MATSRVQGTGTAVAKRRLGTLFADPIDRAWLRRLSSGLRPPGLPGAVSCNMINFSGSDVLANCRRGMQ